MNMLDTTVKSRLSLKSNTISVVIRKPVLNTEKVTFCHISLTCNSYHWLVKVLLFGSVPSEAWINPEFKQSHAKCSWKVLEKSFLGVETQSSACSLICWPAGCRPCLETDHFIRGFLSLCPCLQSICPSECSDHVPSCRHRWASLQGLTSVTAVCFIRGHVSKPQVASSQRWKLLPGISSKMEAPSHPLNNAVGWVSGAFPCLTSHLFTSTD